MCLGVVLRVPDSENFCSRRAHSQKQNKANNGEVMDALKLEDSLALPSLLMKSLPVSARD